MKIVAVVGDHREEHSDSSAPLGRWLAESGAHLLTGGGGGVMTAVSRAFVTTPKRRGLVLGVLPALKPGYPNEWVEIPIRTHLHGQANADGSGGNDPIGTFSRNHINALTADVVIGLPGGKGTLAELVLALRYKKPCFALLGPNGSIGGATPAQLTHQGITVVPDLPTLQQLVGPLL